MEPRLGERAILDSERPSRRIQASRFLFGSILAQSSRGSHKSIFIGEFGRPGVQEFGGMRCCRAGFVQNRTTRQFRYGVHWRVEDLCSGSRRGSDPEDLLLFCGWIASQRKERGGWFSAPGIRMIDLDRKGGA
ncbi:MAG: hypothetical protein CMJ95_13525 [Planctomycetes bacterium]|nr:hypothetical protein [Planctomycetota bacterium]